MNGLAMYKPTRDYVVNMFECSLSIQGKERYKATTYSYKTGSIWLTSNIYYLQLQHFNIK